MFKNTGNFVLYLRILLLLPVIEIAYAEDELVFVTIIYRHGDRTPVEPYPTDPYRNVSYWPTGFGQLTNTGKQQHYELGKWFRKRYTGFLPEKYSNNDIYIRSTDADRTLMSAESNLAGLYSPVDSDLWDPNLKWQPIPVHTVPETSDPILSTKKHCPRYKMELRKLEESREFQRMDTELKPLFAYISNHTGKTIDSIQSLEYLHNTLFIEDLYKFKLPEWTKSVYPAKMLPWANFAFTIQSYTPILQRLKIGLLINEIMERFENKSMGALVPDRKMWIYSAHDITIANVLMALGAFQPHCPPYRSTIIFEMRHSNVTGFYISAFYKNTTEPQPISILHCDLKCPLDTVLELLTPIRLTVNEWETECQSLSAPIVSTIATIAVASCGLLLLFLLISLCIGAVCSKHPQHHRNQLYQPLRDDIN